MEYQNAYIDIDWMNYKWIELLFICRYIVQPNGFYTLKSTHHKKKKHKQKWLIVKMHAYMVLAFTWNFAMKSGCRLAFVSLDAIHRFWMIDKFISSKFWPKIRTKDREKLFICVMCHAQMLHLKNINHLVWQFIFICGCTKWTFKTINTVHMDIITLSNEKRKKIPEWIHAYQKISVSNLFYFFREMGEREYEFIAVCVCMYGKHWL